ncbi:MAG: serine hydrolase [Dermatophilaceae bacterium]
MTGMLSRRDLTVCGVVGVGLGAVTLAGQSDEVAGTSAAARATTRARLSKDLDRYMASRSGVAGLVLRDNRDGRYYAWRPQTQQIHSTVAVLVLVAMLRLAQERHQAFTATQQSLAAAMIRTSDQAATTNLLNQVGVAACRRVVTHLGLRDTTVLGGSVQRSTTWWGNSVSTTDNLVRLMNALILDGYLTADRRSYARRLMASVAPSQTWGLGGGAPDDVHVEQANGWGPRPDGYRLVSVGLVWGRGRSYQLALMSRSPAGYRYGQTTANRLCRIVFDALAVPLG